MSSVAGLIRLPCCSAQWWLAQISFDVVQLVEGVGVAWPASACVCSLTGGHVSRMYGHSSPFLIHLCLIAGDLLAVHFVGMFFI